MIPVFLFGVCVGAVAMVLIGLIQDAARGPSHPAQYAVTPAHREPDRYRNGENHCPLAREKR